MDQKEIDQDEVKRGRNKIARAERRIERRKKLKKEEEVG